MNTLKHRHTSCLVAAAVVVALGAVHCGGINHDEQPLQASQVGDPVTSFGEARELFDMYIATTKPTVEGKPSPTITWNPDTKFVLPYSYFHSQDTEPDQNSANQTIYSISNNVTDMVFIPTCDDCRVVGVQIDYLSAEIRSFHSGKVQSHSFAKKVDLHLLKLLPRIRPYIIGIAISKADGTTATAGIPLYITAEPDNFGLVAKPECQPNQIICDPNRYETVVRERRDIPYDQNGNPLDEDGNILQGPIPTFTMASRRNYVCSDVPGFAYRELVTYNHAPTWDAAELDNEKFGGWWREDSSCFQAPFFRTSGVFNSDNLLDWSLYYHWDNNQKRNILDNGFEMRPYEWINLPEMSELISTPYSTAGHAG